MFSPRLTIHSLDMRTGLALRRLDEHLIQRAFDKGYPVEEALDDGVMDFSDIDGLDETGEGE